MVLSLVALVLAAAPEFSFGFTNDNGTQVLALPPVSSPASISKAVCDGRMVELKFVREQPAGEKDTGRQTARNFSQVKGAVFKLVKGTMPADALCLLGTNATFAKRKLLTVAQETGDCDAKSTEAAAELSKRKVTKCVVTGTLPEGRLSFASYELEGSSALAAVVLMQDKAGPALRKFPATWERGAPSCWRADDGCEFDASSYRVAFAMSGPAGLELYALWAGPEGENAEVLRVKGAELKVVASGGRYWSPE
jgi:hypothetical protein